MTTDNKTLADAQPGGMVRLGDQAELDRLEFQAWASEHKYSVAMDGEQYEFAAARLMWKAWRAAFASGAAAAATGTVLVNMGDSEAEFIRANDEEAALSAQPSPAGREDALATELLAHAEGLARMAADDRETGLSIEQAIEEGDGYTPDEPQDIAAGLQYDAERGDETAAVLRKAAAALAARQPARIYGCCAQPEGELHTAECPNMRHLAARQPVGEPVAYATFRDGRFGSWLFQTRAMAESHDSTAVAGGPANSEIVPLFRSPAQAVDLGDFKALYRAYVRLLESGRDRIRDLGGTCDPVDVMEANDVDLQAARRVIDSQAVGNG